MSESLPNINAATATIKFVPDTTEIDAFKAEMDRWADGFKDRLAGAFNLKQQLQEISDQMDAIRLKAQDIKFLSPGERANESNDASSSRTPPTPDQLLGAVAEIAAHVLLIEGHAETIAANTTPLDK